MEVSGRGVAGAASSAGFVVTGNTFLAVSALVLVLGLLWYLHTSGVFRTVQVETKAAPYGEMTIAYKTGKGAYKNTALASSAAAPAADNSNDLTNPFPVAGNCNYPHIGIYYDDPESVPEPELRYAVGLILSTDDQDPDPQDLEKLLEKGYKLAVLPRQQFAVVSSFPLRTNLSVYVAIYRVYPRLRSYIANWSLCAYPAIEINDVSSDVMHFVMPLSKQEEFFVPEFSEEQISIATTEFSNHPSDNHNLSSIADDVIRSSSRNSKRGESEEPAAVNCSLDEQQLQAASSTGKGGYRQTQLLLATGDAAVGSSLFSPAADEAVFVKPTKPAPKKASKSQNRRRTRESIREESKDEDLDHHQQQQQQQQQLLTAAEFGTELTVGAASAGNHRNHLMSLSSDEEMVDENI